MFLFTFNSFILYNTFVFTSNYIHINIYLDKSFYTREEFESLNKFSVRALYWEYFFLDYDAIQFFWKYF